MSSIYNTGYEVIISGIFAVLIAQTIKFVSHLIVKRSIDFRILSTTGGMPSSHTAAVVSLSTSVGLVSGWDSVAFAISAGYALIVMQDAAGLRRASGKMAVCLNKMMDDFYKHEMQAAGGKLKEMLGHTPFEVFAGAIFGCLFSYFIHFYFIPHFFN